MLFGEATIDLTEVLAQLRLELDDIDAAILTLERLQAKKAQRWRPAKSLIDTARFTPAQRRAVSIRQTGVRGWH